MPAAPAARDSACSSEMYRPRSESSAPWAPAAASCTAVRSRPSRNVKPVAGASGGEVTCYGLRLALERIARLRDRQRPGVRRAQLLAGVRDLVRDQLPAARRVGLVLTAGEEDVAADREGARRHRAGEGGSAVAGVDADVADRLAEPGLERARHVALERASGALRSRDRALDVRVHQPAGEDALAVAHARDELAEAAVAHRARDALQRWPLIVEAVRRAELGGLRMASTLRLDREVFGGLGRVHRGEDTGSIVRGASARGQRSGQSFEKFRVARAADAG